LNNIGLSLNLKIKLRISTSKTGFPKTGVSFLLSPIAETKMKTGSCHKRQKPQAPTPQVPIRNRQTRKVANAKKVLPAILTLLNLT